MLGAYEAHTIIGVVECRISVVAVACTQLSVVLVCPLTGIAARRCSVGKSGFADVFHTPPSVGTAQM